MSKPADMQICIEPARREQAEDIVRLIMTAMTDDCCLYYAGRGRTLDDFARVLLRLVMEEESQYSYRNTLVAVADDTSVAGICVAYDGADLRRLRETFFRACREEIDREFDVLADETSAGEYYIDSLAVYPAYRRQGIATALIRAMAARARAKELPLGLLVDKGNPSAERMYASIGFRYVGDSTWGGHPMKHLQWRC